MKKFFLFTMAIGLSLASCGNAQTPNTNEQPEKASAQVDCAPEYKVCVTHPIDSAKVVDMLQQTATLPADSDLTMTYARMFVGKPYVGFTLDQNKEEQLVVNITGVDCTTYVEYVMALEICHQRGLERFHDFCDVLAHVRYIQGKVGYTTRQHYFTTWMNDNVDEGLIEWVTLPPAPRSAKRTPHVDYMTSHVEAYKMLNAHREWLPQIKEMENKVNQSSFQYIPKAQLKDSKTYKKFVSDGDIIGIVTNKQGLDVSHLGFASWHSDGLHLLNASSIHKKVIDEPMTLYQYLLKQKSSAGIVVVRIAKP